MTSSTPPTVIVGRYRLGPLIGSGGMGEVFRAHDLREDAADGAEIAIKLLHPDRLGDARAMQYFRREGRAAGLIRHPRVVRVLAAGDTEAGEPYVVMRLVPGRPLRHLLRGGQLPTVRRAVSIITQVLSGLEAIHAAGFVHGDVKADNVLIDGDDRVTLIDLGLMRPYAEPGEAHDGFVSGTPDYMAPEIVRGEGGQIESDLYAAGTLLYELLTGSSPFGGGTTSQILLRHLSDAVVPLEVRCPDRMFPAVVEQVVMWALEKRPELRPHSARAFARRLGEALPDLEPARQPTRKEESWPVPASFSTTATTLAWKSGASLAR